VIEDAALSHPRPAILLAVIGLLVGAGLPSEADAVEFRLDGMYRLRANLFDSLSLERGEERDEGVRSFIDQRLRLVPQLRINSGVHVFADIDLLDALAFGANPAGADPSVLVAIGQQQADGSLFNEPSAMTGGALPGEDYQDSLFVRRAWVEVYTPYVDLKIGRMGSHWGLGILANDGSCDTCDYGDIVDRIMISTSMIDPVRISVAVDTRAEGFINKDDDTHSFLVQGGLLHEVYKVGGYVRWTRQPSNKFNLLHGDIWGSAKLGPVKVELEGLINWGSAETTDIGVEDLKILSGGGALEATLAVSPWEAGLSLGVATGDKDPTDNAWHTLRFDRDYDVGLLMFEHPLPQFQVGDAANVADGPLGNVDASLAVTSEGVSNAFYLRPRFHVDLLENLRAGVSLTTAWPVVPAGLGHTDEDPRNFYGVEIDGAVTFVLHNAFELRAAAAAFFPGNVYGETRAFTFGGELRALVRF